MATPVATLMPNTPEATTKRPVKASPASDPQLQRISQNRQRSQRRSNAQQYENVRSPAWEDADAARVAEGDFDAQGRFVMASMVTGQQNNTEEAGPNGQNGQNNKSNAKKPRQKKSKGNRENLLQQGQQGMPPQTFPPPPAPATLAMDTPAKAYAGPTFHASPAASALPMPKFLSKSVPSAMSQPGLQARMDEESESDKSESSPSPDGSPSMPEARSRGSGIILPKREESPLDVFFNADKAEKAEKAKRMSGVTRQTSEVKEAQVSPPAHARVPAHWAASIYGSTRPNHTRNLSHGSSKDVFMMELDGSSLPQAVAPLASPDARSDNVQSPLRAMNSSQGHGNSTSPFASEIDGTALATPGRPSQRSPVNHHAVSSILPPRSAESTPPPPRSSNAAATAHPLHYGNKNLSPLFMAAKNDSSRRNSQLRQELSAGSPTSGGTVAELPDNRELNQPRNPHDHSALALRYLQSRVAPAPTMPKLELQKRASSTPAVGQHPISELDGQPKPSTVNNRNGMFVPQTQPFPPSQQPAFNSPSADLRSMENDLKRMLNLGVVGHSGVR